MSVKVLWTGGWDSTFRVLDAVFNKKLNVQPYYIVDKSRFSWYMEIETMDRIKSIVNNSKESEHGEIHDVEIIDMKDIPENNEITESYKELSHQSHLGNQYDWLARFCHYNNINDIDLCTHRDDNVGKFIRNEVILIESDDKYYKLPDKYNYSPLKLFTYFNFPIFDISKLEMEKISRESGFDHIMDITWFCHFPIDKKPCGVCNPCKYTREEGLERRVPNPTLKNKFLFIQSKLKQKF